MEYDVFISCNSDDYPIAEELYDYLKDNGFKVFLASKKLRKLGESDYRNTISEAIESTYHLIVLGSSIENIASKWVKYEWGLSLGEKLDGHKEGNLMTFVHGNLYVKDLPIDLRHVESFTEADYKDRIIEYVKTPAFLERKENDNKKEIDNNSIGSALQNVLNLSSEDQVKVLRIIGDFNNSSIKHIGSPLSDGAIIAGMNIAIQTLAHNKA